MAGGRRLVLDLRDIRARWTEQVTARRDSTVWRLVDLLLRLPVVNASMVATELSVAAPNVYRHLETLERAGIVTEFCDQKRNRAWRATEVLDALDEFSARARRRSTA